jgi:hypothetical protein
MNDDGDTPTEFIVAAGGAAVPVTEIGKKAGLFPKLASTARTHSA